MKDDIQDKEVGRQLERETDRGCDEFFALKLSIIFSSSLTAQAVRQRKEL